MRPLDRRRFVQLSASCLVALSSEQASAEPGPQVSQSGDFLQVKGDAYRWKYTAQNDQFQIFDLTDRLIVSGRVQPALRAADANDGSQIKCVAGRTARREIANDRVTIEYEGVNGDGRLRIAWRFDPSGIWVEPIEYRTDAAEDIVSVHYFAAGEKGRPRPSLRASYFIAPGISEASTVSPIVRQNLTLNESVWLGRGSSVSGLLQQWGLPVHYFAGFNAGRTSEHELGAFVENQSDAFVCGLGELPNGDFFLQFQNNRCSPWIDYRGDVWKHMRGPGKFSLGARLFWSFGNNYYQAIAHYYRGLRQAGVIEVKKNSARKTAAVLAPQFCTWGAQVARGKEGSRLDEKFLSDLYNEMKASGLKANMFSIDDKWEGRYGKLEHSTERFPHFEQFLEQVRSEGHRIGIWAALMRCERPEEMGLTEEQMLMGADGKPVRLGGVSGYYILDFTQPEVAAVLAGFARKFIQRYKPDLVKFDFGYELPALSKAAPKDKKWAGERMMWKGLDVVITAMREENPDLVVMYYQLSPFFLPYFDLHSPDDLFMNSGEYDLEANRRFFFSSLLGELGVPTYGSTGYDWQSAPSIWFDSTVVGTLGSMNDFAGDERGASATPDRVARYNGLINAVRPSVTFRVVPLDGVTEAQTRGAHSRSWARLEQERVVLLALRPDMCPLAEVPAPARTEIAALRAIVNSPVPVVVSSRTEDDVTQCSRLAVVAYGAGMISIRRRQGARADVVTHYFGGASSKISVPIKDGQLNLPYQRSSDNQNPVEWLEVQIS